MTHVSVACRPDLVEAVNDARGFVDQYSGENWLQKWLNCAGNKASLQEIDMMRLSASMANFQVRSCIIESTFEVSRL